MKTVACLGYIGIRDIGPFYYWDMGYLRQNLMEYGIFQTIVGTLGTLNVHKKYIG